MNKGLKSTCRKLIYQQLGLVDRARPTGDAAFRVMIHLRDVVDPTIREFMSAPIITRWLGPGRHVDGEVLTRNMHDGLKDVK